MNNKKISDGSAAFLVKDKSLITELDEAPFYQWLKAKGFSHWGKHGYYNNVNWVFVNVNSKLFAPGLPGIKVADAIFEHAITIEEFKEIYEIFEKYAGLNPLTME